MPHSQDDSSAEGSDLLSTSTRDSTVNDFPTNNKLFKSTTFHLSNRDTAVDSPAITGFTFTDLEPLKPLEPTEPDYSYGYSHAVTPHAQPEERDANMMGSGVTEASKRRTQYYEDSFAYKDGHGQSAKERIQKDSPVVAELKTNVIVCGLQRWVAIAPCLQRFRSKTSSPWSRTSPSIFQNDIVAQNLLS